MAEGEDFTSALARQDAETLQAARLALLRGQCEGGLYMLHDERVVLTPHSPAGLHLGALAECGEASCACCRATNPHARPSFRKGVVRHWLQMGHRTVRYISLAAGLLLTDAEILSALVEGGANIESIQLVDCAELYTSSRGRAALHQLSEFFVPAAVTAFTSVDALLREAGRADHGRSANLLVACDAGTAVSRALKRTASRMLSDGGLAFTLVNGGEAGVTMRAWRRLPGDAQDVPAWPAPQDDELLRLEELDLRVADPAVAAACASDAPRT